MRFFCIVMTVEQAPHMPEDLATLHSDLAEHESMYADEKLVGPDMYPREVVDDLNQKVFVDEKTGLGTKAALDIYMEWLKQNNQKNLGFLFVDGNEFKQVNDALSYYHGDNYIRRVGHMLDEHTGHTDKKRTKIFRWAGDEFVIILEDIQSADQVDEVGRRLATLFCGGNEADGAVIPTISIGGTFIGSEADDAALSFALVDAETAMKYTKLQSKQQGEQQHSKIATLFHANNNQDKVLHFSPSSYVRYQESTLREFTALFKQTSLAK